MSSLYIHIPFCRSKCHYCAFNSCAGGEAFFDDYVVALHRELEDIARTYSVAPLKTVFLGGGTPTVLAADTLVGILTKVQTLWGFACDAEISTESNPETVDREYLEKLRRGGFNRISFGVQSFDDADLRVLGRPHSAQRAVATIHAARAAGFENLNFDLMSGLVGQKTANWKRVLERALSLSPNHLSIYSLTPEPGTALYQAIERGEAHLPDEDESLAMDELTLSLCHRVGLEQYETSNYAKRGYECRHNINYWQNGSYFAAGAGAVSYLDGARVKRVDDIQGYIGGVQMGEGLYEECETLDHESAFRETVMIGLRMNRGISVSALQSRFGLDLVAYYGETLARLIDQRLIEIESGHLRLTAKGRPLTNLILEKLI